MRNQLSSMSNEELIRSLKALVRDERGRLVLILKHLNEMDERRLAIKSGFPSLFDYCVRELRFAQSEAGRRIQTARAAKKYPIVYRALERGLLSLTTASMLAPHLKWDNYRRLIRAAAGRTAREVEAQVASLSPGQEPVDRIRFMAVAPAESETASAAALGDLFTQDAGSPSSPPAGVSASALENAAASPADPDPASRESVRRVHFSFTADEAFLREVERARQLLWHKSPAGKLERVFAEALKALLKAIDPARRAPRSPRPERSDGTRPRAGRSRTRRAIPRAVQDAVWRRDGGSCAFLSPDGRRCGERSGLEFDHVLPWARGGASDEDNLRLLCRAHNALAARRAFGDAVIEAALANPPPS